MSERNQVPGCLKYGCVGCLSVLALGVLLVFLFSALHMAMDREDPRPEARRAEHRLPEPPERPPRPDRPAIGEVLPLPELDEFPRDAPGGRVLLDLRMGSFSIRPGPADQPIRVDADFDAGAFELEEELTTSEDGAWTYQVSFGGKRGIFGMILGGRRHNVDNRIDVVIPRGHPIDLVVKAGLGELEADLGGLWLRSADFEFGAGDHFLEFRDPLPYPMESFRVDASVGSVEVRELGNASPKSVEVDQGIGELLLDLKGAWRNDAEVDVDFGIGECRLWLPDDVRVDLKRARVALGESSVDRPRSKPLPDDAPTLTVRTSGGIGEVRLEY